jgi:hypothetical protein
MVVGARFGVGSDRRPGSGRYFVEAERTARAERRNGNATDRIPGAPDVLIVAANFRGIIHPPRRIAALRATSADHVRRTRANRDERRR